MRDVNVEKLIEIIEIFSVPGSDIKKDTKILELELIDSLNVMQIISTLEGEYDLSIGAMDLSFDDFETPDALKNALDKI